MTYLVLLVDLLHAALALGLRDDLSGILNNYLMRVKLSHRTHTIATIYGIQNLDAIVIAITLGTLLELRERAIAAKFSAKATISVIAFVSHDAIVASLTTPIFGIAIAL